MPRLLWQASGTHRTVFNIQLALDLGADCLVHGLALVHCPETLARTAALGVTVECCLSGNIRPWMPGQPLRSFSLPPVSLFSYYLRSIFSLHTHFPAPNLGPFRITSPVLPPFNTPPHTHMRAFPILNAFRSPRFLPTHCPGARAAMRSTPSPRCDQQACHASSAAGTRGAVSPPPPCTSRIPVLPPPLPVGIFFRGRHGRAILPSRWPPVSNADCQGESTTSWQGFCTA